MTTSFEPLGIKLIVSEQDGIRRFLYPITQRIPTIYRRSVGALALTDPDGELIPCHIANAPEGVLCTFAVSLAPFETRELQLVRCEDCALIPIPDPLRIDTVEDRIISRQERVAFAIDQRARLASVVYKNVEHLAGPASVTLDGKPFTADTPETLPRRLHKPTTDLYAEFEQTGAHGEEKAASTLQLTCCKSWVTARHKLLAPRPGGVVRFSCPLTVTSELQTCDFGVGNGAYGKIQAGVIDAVVWDMALLSSGGWRYSIGSRLPNGEIREDYAGACSKPQTLQPALWLHWNEPAKALALAIMEFATGTVRIRVELASDGIITVDFKLGAHIASPAEFAVCFHFLDAIPPVAAATNPASLLSPPSVMVSKLY